jgi:hypothetical protein
MLIQAAWKKHNENHIRIWNSWDLAPWPLRFKAYQDQEPTNAA